MSEILAYCGLLCHTCQIYLATREEDAGAQARMRAEIARVCREQYGLAYSPQDITDCDGCPGEGQRLFVACSACKMRNCARARGLETCASCPEYPCPDLRAFLESEPEARRRLDALRPDGV